MKEVMIQENIENMIYEIRGKQVMLSSDIARLYQVETKVLNQTIKRNSIRFPDSFCFQLTKEEIKMLSLRSQFSTLNKSNNLRGQHFKYLPYVLTEQGIMMLSGLLKSEVAARMNVLIVDAFVEMRKYISSNLLEQRYINNQVLKNTEDIKLLQESFQKFEEKKLSHEIFYDGQIYDAYSKIIDIMSSARKSLVIIDAYADKSTLDMISKVNVSTTLITKPNGLLKEIDIQKYQSQYHNLSVIYDSSFHDRFFLIDYSTLYHCGTSLNHAGSKTFAINLLEESSIKDDFIKRIQKLIKEDIHKESELVHLR